MAKENIGIPYLALAFTDKRLQNIIKSPVHTGGNSHRQAGLDTTKPHWI